MAVSALNESWPVRATRKLPDADWTSAAPPTEASGELASIVNVTAPPDAVALIVGSCGALLLGVLGLLGLPQPGTREPSDTIETA
jgi:hypothetical protein